MSRLNLRRLLTSDELSISLLIRALLVTALPVMGSMLGRTFLTFLDNIFVGHLERADVYVAAVATASLLWMVNFRLALGLTTAVTTLVAQRVGAGDYEDSRRYAIAGMISNLLGPGLITLFAALFAPQAFSLLRLPVEVKEVAISYFRILALPSIFGYTVFALSGYYRGIGRTDIPMYFDLFGVLLNALLDYGLIFGKLGMPRMGVMGAAVGTAISIIARGLALILAEQLRLVEGPRVTCIRKMSIREVLHRVKEIYLLGIPASLEGMIMSGSQLVVITLIAPMGALIIATYRLTIRLQGLLFLLGIGFSVANNSIVGQLAGMGRHEEMRRAGWIGALLSGSVSLVIGALTFLLAPQISALITSHAELQHMLAWSIRWIVPAVVLFNMIYPLGGALKGLGDTASPLIIMFITRVLMRLPLIYFVVTKLGGGLREIWMIINADNVVRLAAFSYAWERSLKRWSYGKGGTHLERVGVQAR